jgi:hypothetical protein
MKKTTKTTIKTRVRNNIDVMIDENMDPMIKLFKRLIEAQGHKKKNS